MDRRSLSLVIVLLLAAVVAGACGKEEDPFTIDAGVKIDDWGATLWVSGWQYADEGNIDIKLDGVDMKYVHEGNQKAHYTIESAAFPVLEKATITITATRKESEEHGPAATATKTVEVERPAPRPDWDAVAPDTVDGAIELKCTRGGDHPGSFDMSLDPATGMARMMIRAEPPGATLTVLGKTVEVTVEQPQAIDIVLLEGMWDMPAERLDAGSEHVGQVTLKTPHGREVKPTEVACEVGGALRWLLWRGSETPTLAPGESVGPAIGALSSSGRKQHFGDAKKVRDIHILVTEHTLDKKEKSCGTYHSTTSGRTKTITNTAGVVEVRMVDRRTAKDVAKKVFTAKMPSCPDTLEEGFSGLTEPVDTGEVDAWVDRQLAKASK